MHEVSETSAEASLMNGVEFTFFLPMDMSIYNKVEIAEQEKRVMQIPLSADCSMEAKPEESKNMNRPKILVVDDGQIIQRGTHKELVAVPGKYKDFVDIRSQSEGWKIG